MTTTVRLALAADEEPLMLLLMAMHAEESVEPVDEFKVRSVLQCLIFHQGGVVGVIRGKTGIEGTVGIALDQLWYSSVPHLNKLWLYVGEAHRRSTHAKSMLRFAKFYSDQVGIPLMGSDLVGPGTEKKVDLVGRELGEAGRFFLYNRRIQARLATVV